MQVVAAIALLLASGVGTASAGAPPSDDLAPTKINTPSVEDPAAGVLESGLKTIEKHFMRPMPRGRLEEEALDALLHALDPYSDYLPAGEMKLLREDLEASFGGVGIALEFDAAGGYPRVGHLLYGGAAVEAGIRRGDLLLAIDGRDLKGVPEESIFNALRGAVGAKVTLSVRREGEAAPMPFTLARRRIELPSARPIRVDGRGRPDWWLDRSQRLGYVRVASFAADTVPTVALAMAEMDRGGARGLVLDLRDCAGGSMRAALDTADLFVNAGRLLTVRQHGEEKVYEAKPGRYTRIAIVVLINGGTASAGEILAAAVADNGRATLVGERSFGKGRVQVLYSFGEGRGGMKLSTGTFHRPNGKTIDKHDLPEGSQDQAGVAPDIEVKMGEAEHTAWFDFAEKTSGLLVLTPEERTGAPPDPVLAKAVELLAKR
jgi:carboxyl-terminal processing protease